MDFGSIGAASVDLRVNLAKLPGDLAQAREQVTRLAAGIEAAASSGRGFEGLSQQARTLAPAVAEAAKSAGSLREVVGLIAAAIPGAGGAVAELAQRFGGLAQASAPVAPALAAIQAGTAGASQGLHNVATEAGAAGGAIGGGAGGIGGGGGLAGAAGSAGGAFGVLNASLASFAGYLGAIAVRKVVGDLEALGSTALMDAEQWQLAAQKIQFSLGLTREAALRERAALMDASKGQPFGGTVQLATFLGPSVQELGKTRAELNGLIRELGQLAVVSGSTGDQASRSFTQLGQAFAIGKLQGQDLRALTQDMPALFEAIVRGSGKSREALVEMAHSVGGIPVALVLDALQKEAPAVADAFAKMGTNVTQGMTDVRNAFLEAVGQAGEAANAVNALGAAFEELAGFMRTADFQAALAPFATFIHDLGEGLAATVRQTRELMDLLAKSAAGGPASAPNLDTTEGRAAAAKAIGEGLDNPPPLTPVRDAMVDFREKHLPFPWDDPSKAQKLIDLPAYMRSDQGAAILKGETGPAPAVPWWLGGAAPPPDLSSHSTTPERFSGGPAAEAHGPGLSPDDQARLAADIGAILQHAAAAQADAGGQAAKPAKVEMVGSTEHGPIDRLQAFLANILTGGAAGEAATSGAQLGAWLRGREGPQAGPGTLGAVGQAFPQPFDAGRPGATVAEVAKPPVTLTDEQWKALAGLNFLASIQAFHGTGAAPFEKFDASKIGTGEGAQAYGYGHYFAESEAVAGSYRRKLSGPQFSMDGESVSAADLSQALHDALTQVFPDRPAVAEEQTNRIFGALMTGATPRWPTPEEAPSANKFAFADLAQMRQDLVVKQRSEGTLFGTSLDVEPHQLLDYDKKLNEQSDTVKAALSHLPSDLNPASVSWQNVQQAGPSAPGVKYVLGKTSLPNTDVAVSGSDALGYTGTGPDRRSYPSLEEAQQALASAHAGAMTGSDLVTALEKALSSSPAASEALRQSGLPGLQYLDRDSRAQGVGTRNVVIFPGEESRIGITSVNGQPVRPPAQPSPTGLDWSTKQAGGPFGFATAEASLPGGGQAAVRGSDAGGYMGFVEGQKVILDDSGKSFKSLDQAIAAVEARVRAAAGGAGAAGAAGLAGALGLGAVGAAVLGSGQAKAGEEEPAGRAAEGGGAGEPAAATTSRLLPALDSFQRAVAQFVTGGLSTTVAEAGERAGALLAGREPAEHLPGPLETLAKEFPQPLDVGAPGKTVADVAPAPTALTKEQWEALNALNFTTSLEPEGHVHASPPPIQREALALEQTQIHEGGVKSFDAAPKPEDGKEEGEVPPATVDGLAKALTAAAQRYEVPSTAETVSERDRMWDEDQVRRTRDDAAAPPPEARRAATAPADAAGLYPGAAAGAEAIAQEGLAWLHDLLAKGEAMLAAAPQGRPTAPTNPTELYPGAWEGNEVTRPMPVEAEVRAAADALSAGLKSAWGEAADLLRKAVAPMTTPAAPPTAAGDGGQEAAAAALKDRAAADQETAAKARESGSAQEQAGQQAREAGAAQGAAAGAGERVAGSFVSLAAAAHRLEAALGGVVPPPEGTPKGDGPAKDQGTPAAKPQDQAGPTPELLKFAQGVVENAQKYVASHPTDQAGPTKGFATELSAAYQSVLLDTSTSVVEKARKVQAANLQQNADEAASKRMEDNYATRAARGGDLTPVPGQEDIKATQAALAKREADNKELFAQREELARLKALEKDALASPGLVTPERLSAIQASRAETQGKVTGLEARERAQQFASFTHGSEQEAASAAGRIYDKTATSDPRAALALLVKQDKAGIAAAGAAKDQEGVEAATKTLLANQAKLADYDQRRKDALAGQREALTGQASATERLTNDLEKIARAQRTQPGDSGPALAKASDVAAAKDAAYKRFAAGIEQETGKDNQGKPERERAEAAIAALLAAETGHVGARAVLEERIAQIKGRVGELDRADLDKLEAQNATIEASLAKGEAKLSRLKAGVGGDIQGSIDDAREAAQASVPSLTKEEAGSAHGPEFEVRRDVQREQAGDSAAVYEFERQRQAALKETQTAEEAYGQTVALADARRKAGIITEQQYTRVVTGALTPLQAYREEMDRIAAVEANVDGAVEAGTMTLEERRRKVIQLQAEQGRAAAGKRSAESRDLYDRGEAGSGVPLGSAAAGGAHAGLLDFIGQYGNAAKDAGEITKTSLEGATDALATFATTGKADLASLATSLEQMAIKMTIQLLLARALSAAFGGTPGGAGAANFQLTGSTGAAYGAAHGMAMEGGDRVPMATGGILSRETMIPMAHGGWADAGEQPGNTEAVMPLKRNARGDLGVQTEGGGGGSAPSITINNHGEPVGQSDTKWDPDTRTLEVTIRKMVDNNIASGAHNKSMRSAFGLTPTVRR